MSAKTGAERARLSRERKEADYREAIKTIVRRDAKIEELHAKVAEYDKILSQETKALNYTKAELGKKESKAKGWRNLAGTGVVLVLALFVIVFLLKSENKCIKTKYEATLIELDSIKTKYVNVVADYRNFLDSSQQEFDQWHTEPPPVEVKLSVVTYAWYNDNSEWQSYSNGSVIDVLEWRPE